MKFIIKSIPVYISCSY